MQNIILNDTIAAIATCIGDSGIGIVRISGKGALKIADKIFISSDKKKSSDFKTYTIHYGWVVGTNNNIIDEVILTLMRAPRSYTKEDVVEINCHGGIVALRSVLDLVLEKGARLAEPGEFTRRAFLNGRIDLAQAEAVLDIINAKTDSALKAGLEQLKGALSGKINSLREILLGLLSIIEANIDFPDEQIDLLEAPRVVNDLEYVNTALLEIINSFKFGKILKEGIRVVICGCPNVGKSSLLNALLKQERSIVTHIPGTTRDTIEEIIDIRGIPIRIVDTAGILEPRDLIEKKAILRTKQHIEGADLIILLFDASKKLLKADIGLIKKLKNKPVIAAINKIDLKRKVEKDKLLKYFDRITEISAKKLKNINLLEDAIVNLVYGGKLKHPEPLLLTNARHLQIIKMAQKFIANAKDSLDNNTISPEFIAQDIKDALLCIDELLGKKFSEDLLDKIFSNFCIGK